MLVYIFIIQSDSIYGSGREYQRNDPAVTVDYNTTDQVVRWDSYDNLNQRHEDSQDGTKKTLHIFIIFMNFIKPLMVILCSY